MRKFIVGITGRTGTTIYALWLDAALPYDITKIQSEIHWSHAGGQPDWSQPIQHTHQFNLFTDAPMEFERVWARRNYFDTVISKIIAEKTNTYHIFSKDSAAGYQEKYKDAKFYIDVDDFKDKLQIEENISVGVKEWQAKTNCRIIELFYHLHSVSPEAFYNAVGLPMSDNIPQWPQPMSVNKIELVSNLNELIEIYHKTDSLFDVEKNSVIAQYSLPR